MTRFVRPASIGPKMRCRQAKAVSFVGLGYAEKRTSPRDSWIGPFKAFPSMFSVGCEGSLTLAVELYIVPSLRFPGICDAHSIAQLCRWNSICLVTVGTVPYCERTS